MTNIATNNTATNGRPATALSVSELNRRARQLLEDGLSRLWVEGEVSNLARPASGHVYFTLKDRTAQLRCAWFRQRQRGPAIGLKNGDNMLAFGKVSIYEARGDYQMIVERLEAAGEGELRRRFELLKDKLAAEGLFDEDRKRELPAVPQRIGIVTSPSGAAVRDIISILERRFPPAPVVVYPAAVQGETAAGELVEALQTAASRDECDLLIIGRGGGSLEDLWPFNEEAVARAIDECPIPVISAVGHETDFTIADFVADVRAPTPSGAAEIAVPDRREWLRRIAALQSRVVLHTRRYLEDSAQTLDWLSRRLARSSPAATVARQSARLQNLQQLMAAAMRHTVARRNAAVERIRSELLQRSPALRVQNSAARLDLLYRRLINGAEAQLDRRRRQFDIAVRGLNSVSPLATLERGYAIVTDRATRRVLSDAADVGKGAEISATLAAGRIDATVTGVRKDSDKRG